AVCERVIGEQNHVSSDGKLSWLEVECLGACVNAPMVQISTKTGDHYYEDLTPEIFEDMLAKLRRGEKVKIGTAHPDRKTSNPACALTSLIDPALYDGSRSNPIKELPNSKPAAPEALSR